jgi:hypothetical protein
VVSLPFQETDRYRPVFIEPGFARLAGVARISPVFRLINTVSSIKQVSQNMRALKGFR